MKIKRTRRRRSGFTLLELLLVMAILIVLATLSGVAVMRMNSTALSRAANIQIANMERGCKAFYLTTGQAPNSIQDLYQLPNNMTQSKWGGPHLEPPMPQDPWGKEYKFNFDSNAEKFEIASAGKDGKFGTQDDIPPQQ